MTPLPQLHDQACFMKRHLHFFLFSLCILPFLHSPLHAIEATGMGANERQALNSALSQAVEMSLGAHIEQNTLVENFQVVKDQLVKHSKGYVTRYKILKKSKSETGLFQITIDADVDDGKITDNAQALSTLMQMAAHPRLFITAIDDGFDSVSSLNDDFNLLVDGVMETFRDDFSFQVIDPETARINSTNSYRFSDPKNLIKRARAEKADYILFIKLSKEGPRDYLLNLSAHDLSNQRQLSQKETGFSKKPSESLFETARDYAFDPSSEIAADMVRALKKESFDEGQRFELTFTGFEAEKLELLSTELTSLSGYVRHKIQGQKKNALTLSYWSLMKTDQLHQDVLSLLKARDMTSTYSIRSRNLTYRFKDPLFE
jgi:hypothetical protein